MRIVLTLAAAIAASMAGLASERLAISFPIWALYDMGPGGHFADPDRAMGELKARGFNALRFDDGAMGMAMELSETVTGAVLFDADIEVKVGSFVTGTGETADVPVGEELLGRVIDPLGRPLDGMPLGR